MRLLQPARLAAALVGLAVLASARSPHAAVDAAEQARRDAVVARAGTRTATVGQLENLLAVIPRYQLLDSFGTTPDAIRHKLLDTVVVPDMLYSDGAEDRKLTDNPDIARRLLTARAEATERAIEKGFGPTSNIPVSDLRAYFDSHKEQFEAPIKIGLWRILCATQDEARLVLAEAQKDGDPKHYGQLAREHSRDKATSERGGDLGLIIADGTSSETGLKVDPALFAAAARVKDGQFVPEPVPEQGMFAVVWRRGTLPERHQTFEQASPQIREQLAKQRFKDAVTKLTADLRAAHVHDLNESAIDGLEIDTESTEILGKRRPGQAAPITQIGQRPSGSAMPSPRISPALPRLHEGPPTNMPMMPGHPASPPPAASTR